VIDSSVTIFEMYVLACFDRKFKAETFV